MAHYLFNSIWRRVGLELEEDDVRDSHGADGQRRWSKIKPNSKSVYDEYSSSSKDKESDELGHAARPSTVGMRIYLKLEKGSRAYRKTRRTLVGP